MVTRTQKYLDTQGAVVMIVTHIYSDIGHFERDGLRAGNHIQLGTNDSADNYNEVPDETGGYQNIPASLPDIILPDPEEEPDADAAAEDYETALAAFGVE